MRLYILSLIVCISQHCMSQIDTIYVKKILLKDTTLTLKNKYFILTGNAKFEVENLNLRIENCTFKSDENTTLKLFTSTLKVYNSIFEKVNIYHNTDNKSIKIENCNFINCDKGIDLRIGDEKQKANAIIKNNRFENCIKGINFRAQKSKKVEKYALTISCNDFIKTPASGNSLLTAIYVEPNTRMVDIGNCNTQPAGNEIIDPTNTMRSIWNLGTSFDYVDYTNENLWNYPFTATNFMHSPFSTTPTNQRCPIIADDNTCIGTPGILNRPINGNGTAEDELDKVGFSADSRYKNNSWFTESTLGDALPNPATNQVIIPVIVSEESRSSKIIIYNSIGAKPLVEQNVSDNGEIQLDVSNLASGMYFYSLMVNGAIVDTKKLIIKK